VIPEYEDRIDVNPEIQNVNQVIQASSGWLGIMSILNRRQAAILEGIVSSLQWQRNMLSL
jgi:hypothetical protein